MPDTDQLLQAQMEATIEPNVREEPTEYGVGIGLMYWMAQAGQIIAPWWSKTRDKQLRRFWKDADHISSAFWMIGTKMVSVPFTVIPRDMTIKSHVKQADYYNSLLQEEIEFGGGWSEFWMPFFLDLWTQDNGAFGEVLGGGKPDGPIEGPVIGLRHLDSYRCSRTSSPQFPVIYQATDSKKYKLHHTRVIHISQMKSPAEEMYGVGHSWLTRAINKAQELVDISIYKQEKLGSRPPRQLLIGKGISTKELGGALRLANESMDNEGLTRFSKTAIIGSKNPEIAVDRIDLATVPDGFDEQTSTELGMFLIALAGGFPPRWIWPASSTGATIADAIFSHISGTGGGASWHLQAMTRLLAGSPRGAAHSRGKVLPPHLKIVFDYQDDEQDRAQSEIRKSRADYREKNLNTGSTTVRVNREQMLSDGEITEPQFKEMELADGRLPDGQDVLTLFVSDDPAYQEMLDLEVEEPLLTIANDPEEMLVSIELAAIEVMYIASNSTNKILTTKAENALAALGKLKAAYEPLVAQAAQEQMEAEAAETEAQAEGEEGAPQEGQPPQEDEEERPEPFADEPADEEEEEEEPSEEEAKDILETVLIMKELEPALSLQDHYEVLDKAFNFGAQMGQVISGSLARGAGGRFVNAAQLAAQRDQIRQRIASRLRGSLARRRKRRPLGAATPRAKLQEERKTRLKAFLTALREKRAEAAKPKPKKGGAKKKPKPKKEPKKKPAGRARKPKKDPEVEAKKKRADQAKKRDEVFDRITDAMDIAKEDLDGLHAFLSAGKEGDSEGNIIDTKDPSPEVEARLVSTGLLQYDQDGSLVSTGAARSLLAAARTENHQRAKEAVSRARRLHAAKAKRVEDLQERASKETKTQEDTRAEMESRKADWVEEKASLEERLSSLQEDPETNAEAIRDTEDRISDKEDKLQDRLDKLQDKIDKSEEKAETLKADAERLARQIGLITEGDDEETKEVRLKSASSFRGEIRSAIRGLWGGHIDLFGFTDSMVSAIRRNLTNAWHEGAKSCGIKENELTPEEVAARDTFVNGQMLHVMDFGSDIEVVRDIHLESPRDQSGKLGPLLSRGEMWANRYQEAYAKGKVMACANKKLRWDLGEAEHCDSCLKLTNKVKRAKYWHDRGIIPAVAGADYLDCRGYNCQCKFTETDEPQSKGPLPSLP